MFTEKKYEDPVCKKPCNQYNSNIQRKLGSMLPSSPGRIENMANQLSALRFAKKNILQLATKEPTLGGGDKATTVKLTLAVGDKPKTGSVPSVDCDGWDALKGPRGSGLDLTKTAGRNQGNIYVRFHVLNENSGGPGDEKGNLTSTTKKANHNVAKWNPFETTLKSKIINNTAVAKKMEFDATVSYPGSNTVYWENGGTQITTDDADYPNKIVATLDEDDINIASVTLDGSADGLYPPSYFKTVPYWKKYDSTYTTQDTTGQDW